MHTFLVRLLIVFTAIPMVALAQQGILGKNLIVNGDAEAGPAGTSLTVFTTNIPGWTATGKPNVLPYGLTGLLQGNDPAPPLRGFNYFVAGSTDSTLTQDIDVSSGASILSTGNVRFTAAAYLGSAVLSGSGTAQLDVSFKNANGQTFSTSTATLGPVGAPGRMYDNSGNKVLDPRDALSLQQQIGLVPPGATRITVTLTLTPYAAADGLSLQLDLLETNSKTVLGPNLIANPGAEMGSGTSALASALNIPGWSTYEVSVAPYGGNRWIGTSDPGPSDRGVNVFWGYGDAKMYQDIDVSAAAATIDSGKTPYQISAWLGALNGGQTPTLTYTFFDWAGNQKGVTAQLGPATHSGTSLALAFRDDVLPAGTRRVHIVLTMPGSSDTLSLADSISFALAQPGDPVIFPNGIVPVYSSSSIIEPGSWASIYGTNLAATTSVWNGNFPTSLGDVTVTVNSKAAYLWLVSPGQINFQPPDDTATGTVPVVITTAGGSATSYVTLAQFGPSFSLLDVNKHVTGIILRSNGSGAYGSGSGSYDIIGPTGTSLGYSTVSARSGDSIVLFGVGFGPTAPPVLAGQAFSGAAPTINPVKLLINNVTVTPDFAGISSAGLYQLNLTVPTGLGRGDVAIQATVGGVQTPTGVVISLQ